MFTVYAAAPAVTRTVAPGSGVRVPAQSEPVTVPVIRPHPAGGVTVSRTGTVTVS